MIETIQSLNYILSVLGLVTIAVSGVLVFDLFKSKSLAPQIQTFGLWVAFATVSAATILAFVYSDYFGIVPCGYCWLQRVFLFPQIILLGMAIYYNDRSAARYGIGLSIAGFAIAFYQHLIQMGVATSGACPTSGGDCGQRFLFEFGFMTFPLLAAIVFAFLIVLYTYVLKTRD